MLLARATIHGTRLYARITTRETHARAPRNGAGKPGSMTPSQSAKPFEAEAYDPFAPDVIEDPYPHYKRLLEGRPVYRDERNDLWVLSRHEFVQAALREHRVLSSAEGVAYQR